MDHRQQTHRRNVRLVHVLCGCAFFFDTVAGQSAICCGADDRATLTEREEDLDSFDIVVVAFSMKRMQKVSHP